MRRGSQAHVDERERAMRQALIMVITHGHDQSHTFVDIFVIHVICRQVCQLE